ncbi:MAG: DegT/DnrJ/EryC1/StrS family aminotransferase [Myxococcota bacterium]|nr:DegT/DnrJ/EryC1/StrS family aminotransferase [Myxococcota bacterium]
MSTSDAIPFLDLEAENEPLQAEIDAALRSVIESQRFVLGPEVEAFESEFAVYCGSRFAVGCASGSDALLLALMALGIGSGDQVVCPSYTFFATASAIRRLGATPVFADIDRHSFNLDPEQARKAAARCSRLRAFLPVDLFGQMADMRSFCSFSDEFDVPVVADAAQSVGARDPDGKRAGSVGTIACFSLYPTKNLGAFGDGGIVVTDDPDLAEHIRMLREHGARERYFHQEIGINSRLDSLQAAVLRVKLRRLDRQNEKRRANAAHYEACFSQAGGDLEISTPTVSPAGGYPVYHQYAIRVPAEHRDGLRSALAESRIGTQIYYPLGLHQQESFAQLGNTEGGLPETEAASRESLCLPIHPGLTSGQIERVVETTADFLSGRCGRLETASSG